MGNHRAAKSRKKPLIVHQREIDGRTIRVIKEDEIFSISLSREGVTFGTVAPFYSVGKASARAKQLLREHVEP
jgi:hypothetical protein